MATIGATSFRALGLDDGVGRLGSGIFGAVLRLDIFEGKLDLLVVDALARQSGLELVEQRQMPSNNLALLWRMGKACAST